MADISIANLPAFLGAQVGATSLAPFVDIADTSESPLGTTKRFTFQQLLGNWPGSVGIGGSLTVFGAIQLPFDNQIQWGGAADAITVTAATDTMRFFAGGTVRMEVDAAGAQLYGNLLLTAPNASRGIVIDSNAGNASYVQFGSSGAIIWEFGRGILDGSNDFEFISAAGAATVMRVSAATNAITFGSSVQIGGALTIAGALTISGGSVLTAGGFHASSPATAAMALNTDGSQFSLATNDATILANNGSGVGLVYLTVLASGINNACLVSYHSPVITIIWSTGGFSLTMGQAGTVNLTSSVGLRIDNGMAVTVTCRVINMAA